MNHSRVDRNENDFFLLGGFPKSLLRRKETRASECNKVTNVAH